MTLAAWRPSCIAAGATAGTTNFDNRAFALNEENNVCIYNRAVAAEFETLFKTDLAACDRVDLAEWERRGAVVKACEFFASFLKEQV